MYLYSGELESCNIKIIWNSGCMNMIEGQICFICSIIVCETLSKWYLQSVSKLQIDVQTFRWINQMIKFWSKFRNFKKSCRNCKNILLLVVQFLLCHIQSDFLSFQVLFWSPSSHIFLVLPFVLCQKEYFSLLSYQELCC